MVIYETRTLNGVQYDYAHSDAGRYLVRDGQMWEEAYDPLGSGKTYAEGDAIATDEAEEILGILLGGADD